jgi:hypothetical protein
MKLSAISDQLSAKIFDLEFFSGKLNAMADLLIQKRQFWMT